MNDQTLFLKVIKRAKAIWGEDEFCETCACTHILDWDTVLAWQYHLAETILESDPIKFLSKFKKISGKGYKYVETPMNTLLITKENKGKN